MYKEINEYQFFDGVNSYNVNKSYDNWLSSIEYNIYIKSHVKIEKTQIDLFGSNTKKIQRFFLQNKELFSQLNQTLNFVIEEKEDQVRIYKKKFSQEDYYVVNSIINKKSYIIFYSLGGSKSVENITIHNVFINASR
ncbi:hypothetical protein [uncultured Tenacibaculum sp.]|uniref:hypothetical protein n=1 Tax=uncultured Tenacibaculum sp. TaxID=174713 RepID=UPI00262A4ECE|nr:hypothetical protein [uncultured Tenacibaculum sp.]